MSQISPEQQLQRERDAKTRIVVTVVAGACIVAGALLPHVTVVDAAYFGRSLFRVQYFFLKASAAAGGWGSGVDLYLLSAGIVVTYYAMAAQMIGSFFSLFSVWSLLTETVGRWVRRLALVAGWFLTISAPMAVTGWRLLNASGVPADLGVAYLFALAGGLIMLIGAHAARKRLDSTWYWTKPDLIT